jgi:hypothetical protein
LPSEEGIVLAGKNFDGFLAWPEGRITSTIHVLILVPGFFVLIKERALRHGTLRPETDQQE